MTWSKKNENWSKIVGGVGFWKIAQKLKKKAITQKLSKNLKKFHQQKRLRIWFYTFLVSFRKIVWEIKELTQLLNAPLNNLYINNVTSSFFRGCLHIRHIWIYVVIVGGDNDVYVLDNTLENLVEFFLFHWQLKESPVHLVHVQNRLDTLSNSLAQYSVILEYRHTHQTTTRAPSVTCRAAVISDEKSTWPGESIRFTKKPNSPFSCWSGLVMRAWVGSSNSKYYHGKEFCHILVRRWQFKTVFRSDVMFFF